jgi:hypothetical protein
MCPEKYENDGYLSIVDSVKTYSYNRSSKYQYNIVLLFYYSSILKQAESLGKKGISVISAMNYFYQYEQVSELLYYE